MAFLRLTSEVANVLGSVVVVAMFFSPARGPLEVAKRVEKQNEVVCPPDLTHGVWRVTDEVTHTERPNAIGLEPNVGVVEIPYRHSAFPGMIRLVSMAHMVRRVRRDP